MSAENFKSFSSVYTAREQNIIGLKSLYNVLTSFPLSRLPSSYEILVKLFRFVILHLLFLIVGLGSTVFHMTLKYDPFKKTNPFFI